MVRGLLRRVIGDEERQETKSQKLIYLLTPPAVCIHVTCNMLY